MKRPLIIFYGYLEIHNASAQIARTFWEHLPLDEYSPTVICADIDSSFVPSIPIIKVKDNYFLHFIGRVFKKLNLKDFTMIPDVQYYSWNSRVLKKVKQILKKEHFDYIHTISTPQSTHLLGLKIKDITGLPLIMQCNDPWHDTSGRNYRFSFCAEKDLVFEGRAANGANVIIHSNQVISDIWQGRYGDSISKKIRVVPFSFNIYNLPKINENKGPNERIVISHIGNIYSSRSSITVFKGVEQLLSEHPEFKDRFVIQFIGQVPKSEMDYVRLHYLGTNIKFLGSIAPEELHSYYEQSDIFLIIDVVIKRNPNYPSKLMLYYYYRKPIVALTTANSNIEKELMHSGHSVCYYENPQGICDYLNIAITRYETLQNFNKNEWEKHTVENVKRIYNEIIESLI